MNQLEQIRLDAARLLAEFVRGDRPDYADGTPVEDALPVIDAVATYAISAFVRAPDDDPTKHAIHAAGAVSLERRKRREANHPGTTPDPTPDG